MRKIEDLLDEAVETDSDLVHELGQRLDLAQDIFRKIATVNSKILADIFLWETGEKPTDLLSAIDSLSKDDKDVLSLVVDNTNKLH